MRRCIIQACRKKDKKDAKNRFYTVPKNLREKWLEILQMEPSDITKQSAICSIHFTKDDFVTFESRMVLKKGVVPTLNLTVEEIEQEKQNLLTRLQINDFDEVCRTCLNRSELVPIFEFNDVFIDVLRRFTNIQFEKNDDLPQNICTKCVNYITKMTNFVVNCQRINDTFHNCFIKLDHNYFIKNTDVTIKEEDVNTNDIKMEIDDYENVININLNEMEQNETDLSVNDYNRKENLEETDFMIQEKNITTPNLIFNEINSTNKSQNEDLEELIREHTIINPILKEKLNINENFTLNEETVTLNEETVTLIEETVTLNEDLDNSLCQYIIPKDLENEEEIKKELPKNLVCQNPSKKKLNESTNTTVIRYGGELTTCDTDNLSKMDIIGYECLSCANMFPTYDTCKNHIYFDHALPLSKLT